MRNVFFGALVRGFFSKIFYLPNPVDIFRFEKVRRNFCPGESRSELRTVVVSDGLLVVVNPGPGKDSKIQKSSSSSQSSDAYLRLRVSPGASSGSESPSVALRLFLRIFFLGELLDFLEGDVGVLP